jgi:hypothetical protein
MTMQDEDNRLGQVAYEAYSANTGGKSLASGDDLPAWDQLADVYRTAWIATARDVIANMAADDEAAMTVPEEPEDEGDEAPVA